MLDRREAISLLLQDRGDALIVSGLGSPTYDVASVGDDDRNFYLWGAMGGAGMVGLGLAQAQPQRRVLVVTGDGEMLMGMGSLATLGMQQPANLGIIVLNNGHYLETGRQESAAGRSTDLCALARACGFKDVSRVTDTAELAEASRKVAAFDGLFFMEVAISPEDAPRVLPLRDGATIKTRFRQAIGLEA